MSRQGLCGAKACALSRQGLCSVRVCAVSGFAAGTLQLPGPRETPAPLTHLPPTGQADAGQEREACSSSQRGLGASTEGSGRGSL